MQEVSDDNILQLISENQSLEHGYRLLMSKYQERLYWHCRRMIVDHDDTNDVIQNTFIKVFRNIKGFQANSKLYTWLYRIATNEALTYLSKKNKKRTHSIDETELGLANKLEADSYFDGNEASRLLQVALAKLPEKQKLVFNMRYYDEMSYKDMSNILDTSEGSLKASFHHAVKKVETYVKNNHDRSSMD